ncbi:uncharacterized protein Fot_53124 [Forsythia ovata]|uniref:S-protein homolog n=1 Tax=Forsythia ovata TaxID=205694 RepID=A0ABD1PHT0_9LAMI
MKFTSALPKGSPSVILNCTVDRFEIGSYTFKPVDYYQLKVALDDIHYCEGLFGSQFASVRAYEPARDKGRATIFWKIDVHGFSKSYDNSTFKKVAPWENE